MVVAIVVMFTSYAVCEMGVSAFYTPEPKYIATTSELSECFVYSFSFIFVVS